MADRMPVSDNTDLARLRQAFRTHFGAPAATALVRAPGRVNLIGEHIDYNGLSVLPMALQRHVALLLRPRADGTVRIVSLDPLFEPREFVVANTIPHYPLGDWGNYVKAPVQALAREYAAAAGFDAVLGSSVPVAGGLSSSSALVIAVALALLHANGLTESPIALAERMAAAERYVGLQGGGMDQAICLGARPGTASRVDFHPLRLTPLPVPPGWRIVVASSLTRAEKSGGAKERYNRRTQECREALERVRVHLGYDPESRDAAPGYRELLAAHQPAELLEAGAAVLTDPVLRRYRHVVTEADRVARCEAALLAGDLATFGRLLSAGHASLRDDYEVSSPELDELTRIAEAAGAAGARLTGAGMGGCILAAADQDSVAGVLAALTRDFYRGRTYTEPLDQHLFVAEPAGGATVEKIQS
jgi:galactokinase